MRTETITRRLFMSGRVQGVSFRAGMVAQARRLGARGWVRNRGDGRVEAVVQGRPACVAQMIAWAHDGPPGADVTQVVVADAEAAELVDFRQRETV